MHVVVDVNVVVGVDVKVCIKIEVNVDVAVKVCIEIVVNTFVDVKVFVYVYVNSDAIGKNQVSGRVRFGKHVAEYMLHSAVV